MANYADDPTNFAAMMEWIRTWGGLLFGGGGAGAAVYAGRKLATFDSHGERIEKLEKNAAEADRRMNSLPTREEINGRFDRIDQWLLAIFDRKHTKE